MERTSLPSAGPRVIVKHKLITMCKEAYPLLSLKPLPEIARLGEGAFFIGLVRGEQPGRTRASS